MRAATLAVIAVAAFSAAVPAWGTPAGNGGAPPEDGERRFEIVRVGDSTVSVLARHARWVRTGTYGIAVNPRQRDVLVARLVVLSRSADTAIAVVTGQTTRLTTDYVAIFRRPSTPILRQRVFWGGVAAGLLAGASAVLVLLRGR